MPTRTRIITIALSTIVILTALGFGISAGLKAQNAAQLQATLNGAPTTGVTQIEMRNFAYSPANVQIHVGTTLTWVNHDDAPHTITFEQDGITSGMLAQNAQFHYTFNQIGTYTYHCTVHPEMLGKITVIP